jgi:hypothetical protein
MNIDEIKAKMDEMLASCDHWKKSQDGSYEMALDRRGYYKLQEQYKALKESNNG